MKYHNFLDKYNREISPALKKIDLMIKSGSINIPVEKVSRLLYISVKEVKSIMQIIHISSINSSNIPSIMLYGSDYICRIFANEIMCGCPDNYTPNQISYIYEIDLNSVCQAYKKLNIEHIARENLALLFYNIIL